MILLLKVYILSYLERNELSEDLFVKIDIEALDRIVIDRLLEALPDRLISIIFEFSPQSFGGFEDSIKYLDMLGQSYYLFDLFYSPNPTRLGG